MKRSVLFSLLLALLLALFSLMGCGGDKENSSQPTGGQTAAKDTTQDVDDSIASLFAKGKQIEGMSYDFIMTSQDMTVNSKVWMEGNKIKTDSVMEGQNIITIVDGDTFYTYFPEEHRAMKMTPDQQSGQKTETPADFTEDADTSPDKYKVVETTVYEGVECKVVVVTSADGKEQSKMWVRRDYGIPIRIELTDLSEGKTVIEFKNLKIGKQQADTFQLPAGVEVIDASEMLKNLPQMPSMPGDEQ
ncbi:MAG: outer membrane lipoprotein-sorting protein [Desulfotomaculaceae bacterium]|nr:outer membrane lipoprotein-sorting protein [Desulfotomaculaceae bacterium]